MLAGPLAGSKPSAFWVQSLSSSIVTKGHFHLWHFIGNKSEDVFIKRAFNIFYVENFQAFLTFRFDLWYICVLEKMKMCPEMSWKCPGILLWRKCGNPVINIPPDLCSRCWPKTLKEFAINGDEAYGQSSGNWYFLIIRHLHAQSRLASTVHPSNQVLRCYIPSMFIQRILFNIT